MGCKYINGWEARLGKDPGEKQLWKDSGWIPYMYQANNGAKADQDGLTNINWKDPSPGLINGVRPTAGGSFSMGIVAENNKWAEAMSPEDLMDGGHSSQWGRGLKRFGFRFFYCITGGTTNGDPTPQFRYGADALCRFYDATDGRMYNNESGEVVESGKPLFRLTFCDHGDLGKAGLQLWDGNGSTGNNLWATTTESCIEHSTDGQEKWVQIAIIVYMIGTKTYHNDNDPAQSKGKIEVYVNGNLVLSHLATTDDLATHVVFDSETAAQSVGSFSFVTHNPNSSGGGEDNCLNDNIVVYDFNEHPGPLTEGTVWNDITSAVIEQNQVVCGVFPVFEGEEISNNHFGNGEAQDDGNISHMHLQGDAENSLVALNPPENAPMGALGTFWISKELDGINSKYVVDTWGPHKIASVSDMGNISEVRAIRVISVVKGETGGESVRLTLNAAVEDGAGSSNNESSPKIIQGINWQIISNTWARNPDGVWDAESNTASPGPFNLHAFDSLIIGLKADSNG